MADSPHRVECNGKVFTARKFDRGMNKQWASWLYAKYRDVAREDHEQDNTSNEDFESDLKLLRDLYFAGEFRLLSERGTAAMLTEEGAVFLAQLIFGLESEVETIGLMAARQNDVGETIKLVLQESFPSVTFRENGAAPDPNAPRPPAGWIDPRRPKPHQTPKPV